MKTSVLILLLTPLLSYAAVDTSPAPREFFCQSQEGEPLTIKASLQPSEGTAGELTYEIEGPGFFQITDGTFTSYAGFVRVYINPGSLNVRTQLPLNGTSRYDSFHLFLPGSPETAGAAFLRDRMIISTTGIAFDRKTIPLNCI